MSIPIYHILVVLAWRWLHQLFKLFLFFHESSLQRVTNDAHSCTSFRYALLGVLVYLGYTVCLSNPYEVDADDVEKESLLSSKET